MPELAITLRAAGIFVACLAAPASGGADCSPLDLAVLRVEGPPSQYKEFCGSFPNECRMEGDALIALTERAWREIAAVHAEVEADINPASDIDCHGREEFWTLPISGFGDCEDVALEKRRRLVAMGYPSAALTMAIVHHRVRYFPHAILLVETDRGTFALDDLAPTPACWEAIPYEFERRERPDGLWTRFVRPNRSSADFPPSADPG